MHADACDCHVSFSVHCPAGCSQADYIVYGTTEYRGVCERIVLFVSQLLYQCWRESFFLKSEYTKISLFCLL